MACLRRQALEGCVGAFQCNEEGCELGLFSTGDDTHFDGESSEADCVLQLRLRTRIAENLDEGRGSDEDREFFNELERRGENDRFFLPVEGVRLHSVSIDPVPLDPACTIQWVKPAEDISLGELVKNPKLAPTVEHFEYPRVTVTKDQLDGFRPNVVYLDEYQRWVGNWEDFDVDTNKYVMLQEAKLVMPAIELDTSKWWKQNPEESHIIRGEN